MIDSFASASEHNILRNATRKSNLGLKLIEKVQNWQFWVDPFNRQDNEEYL